MLKSDFKRQKNPCLWRIDGKNLLQKYEPILYKGSIAFRNISTVSLRKFFNHLCYEILKLVYSTPVGLRTIRDYTFPLTLNLHFKARQKLL